jgi:hypothetical protein
MNQDTDLSLFQEGFQSYIDALAAIKEFNRAAYSRSRKVLEANSDDLERNLRRRLERDSVTLYVSPAGASLDTWDGTWAWVAAKVPARDLCTGYFGLCWRGEGGEPPKPGAFVDFDFWGLEKPLFNTFLQHLKSLAGERILPPYGRELKIWESIDPANAASFSDTLDAITKEWIALLGQIPAEDYPTSPQDH